MLLIEKQIDNKFTEVNEFINRARSNYGLPSKTYNSNISFKSYPENIRIEIEKVYITMLGFESLFEDLEKMYGSGTRKINIKKI